MYILPHNPSVRTLALLQLESSEGEPYTSKNTLYPTIPYVSSKGLCFKYTAFKLSGNLPRLLGV